MELTPTGKRLFHAFIFDWWKDHRRDLPWRHTHSPYNILLSEVMLQQTQVSRVLPKYQEFLALFPTVHALSDAQTAAVLRAWKGMGYNRRALYLQKAAQVVVTQYGGVFPQNEAALRTLPAVGVYTARALLVFAFKKDVAMVDTNIRQIITHFFFKDVPQSPNVIQKTADRLVPAGKSWEWHQALMDFGALEMKKRKPKAERKKGKIPFRQTNRFYRGRIMDVLREGDMQESVLIEEFCNRYEKEEAFLLSVIEGLHVDGLVSRIKGTLSLPR